VTETERFDVVIAGAGIGGAACALALAHLRPELRVLLVEQHRGAGNLNRGDNLLPTITTYLHEWGCVDRLREAGARELNRMQVWADGRRLMEVPLSRPDEAPYLVLTHPAIERVLVEAACVTGRVEVRYRSRVAGLVVDDGRVVGARLVRDGQPEEVASGLVVGADGSHSQVRQAMGIELHRQPYDHGYWGIALDRPASYEDAMRLELHARGGILVVPRLEPGRIGLGVLVQKGEEALFRAGALEDKLAEVRRRSPLFEGCAPHPEGAHLYRLSKAHARRYVAPGAALVGDAIHLTNPVAGQGMTMAIEDAATLARHVAPALATGVPRLVDRALRAYQAERRPLNHDMLRWSHALAHAYAHPGAGADWLRRRLFALGGTPLGRGVHSVIYGRLATRARPVAARAAAPVLQEASA
jgi:salicylate hydroxylase